MRDISIKAIVLATLAVFGIDVVSGFVLLLFFGGRVIESGMNDEQRSAAMLALTQDSGYLTAALILGTASTVLGGYLTSRLARKLPYFNALAFGALGVVLGWFMSTESPTWFRAIALAATIPAALLGAYAHGRRPRPPQIES
ncbi:MAG TPA: hypothetical protein VHK24_14370 [Steroidobacter sp.]|nr:hypothetical protein [Steroidobacter sp.]